MAVVAAIVVLGGLGTLALVVWRGVVAARPHASPRDDDLDHL
ncbi:MAG: hypothetical protein ACYDAC_01085 [Candidatus Dormibacteria bacterium]